MPICLYCGKRVDEITDDEMCASCWAKETGEQPNNVDEYLEIQRQKNRPGPHRGFRKDLTRDP